ncbi:MAG: UDP-N-acetylglucosamine 4-epimerase [Limisphaerales bacterium]|jgi:UDP-N-acetylglucosamine 4-epimerase
MYQTAYHTEDISKTSFLVTGGAGFIGSHLVEYLLKHGAAKVRVLDNFATGFRSNLEPFAGNPAFELFEGDIRDAETCFKACEGIDFVSHQAAMGSVPRSIKDPISTNDINIGGFVNVLFAAVKQGVKRMVFASSSSVYGDDPTLPKEEDRTGRPLSPYAVTKVANEAYARVAADFYDLELIGFRYFNVFGPRQDPDSVYAAVIPKFIDKLISGESVTIDGDGGQTRDFTFVANVVQANVKALTTTNKDALYQIYNIGAGGKASVLELYHHIREAVGSEADPIHGETRAGDIRDSLANISKARTLLGYEPDFDLSQGLVNTVSYFRERVTT